MRFNQQFKHFRYFNDLLQQMRKKQRTTANTFYLCGSRKSGKTTAYQNLALAMLLMSDISADAYFVRKQVQDANELFKEFNALIEQTEINRFYINKSSRIIKYDNKEVRIMGLETNTKTDGKSKVKLGLATGRNKDYGVIVFEECYEFNEDQINAFIEAVRGYKYFIIIYASNPWSIKNWYIAECNQTLRFDERTMRSKFQQFKFNPRTRTVNHYTSYMLNDYVSQDEKDQLTRLLRVDPVRARVSVLGMPGIAEGTVYSGYFEKIGDLRNLPQWYNNTDYFVGGIDWAQMRDKAVAQLWAVGFDLKFVAGIDEYVHTNKNLTVKKTAPQMIEEMVSFYIKWARAYGKIRVSGLTVYVDYAAQGIIDYLNLEARKRGCSDWLYFKQCVKYPIAMRIDHFTLAMSMGKMFLNAPAFDNLIKELETCEYDDNGKRMDGGDDSINTKEYALAHVMKGLTREFNDVAFNNEGNY